MWLVAPLEANPLLPNKPRRWRDESECENKEQAEATPLGPFFFFCLSGAGHRSFSSVTRLSLAPSHASTLSWRHPNHTTALEWHRSASSDRKAELLPHHSGEREKNKGGESGGWGRERRGRKRSENKTWREKVGVGRLWRGWIPPRQHPPADTAPVLHHLTDQSGKLNGR